jgi:virginiamycin A acetyltransferase
MYQFVLSESMSQSSLKKAQMTLYYGFTRLFGHHASLNNIINKFSNSNIKMKENARIGRNTQIMGDVEIESEVSINDNVSIQGNIDVGHNASINSDVNIKGDVTIGKNTKLNGSNSVIGDIKIGKYCAVAPRARMRTEDHPTYKPGMQGKLYQEIGANLNSVSNGPIVIGNDVWICSDSKILSDVSIGNGAVIAANSVVVDDVEPYAVVAGNPATTKKYRFNQEKIETLQNISWWDWPEEKKKHNIEFFNANIQETENIESLVK